MLKANATLFVTTTVMVEEFRHTWRKGKGGGLLSFPGSVLAILRTLRDECRRLAFNGTADQIDRIELLNFSWDESATQNAIETVWSIFERELDARRFYVVDLADNAFLESHGLLADTVGKFPRATREITEARKCLAVDQPDAAVFHSMRALEVAILALAAEFPTVSIERDNWEAILGAIATAFSALGRSLTKPQNWKELEQFYSEACADFRLFKNAWRNYVMHARTTYGPGEARDVVALVCKFLDHLATRLHEQNATEADV